MDFGRLITAMVTPFDEQLRINWDLCGQLIEYLIETQRSDSLVVCGTTGESPTLSEQEKLQLIEFVIQKTAGRCKIIAGTGSNDTMHSIHLSKQAEQLGVDGLLLVNPYYNRPNQAGLYKHFRTIAEAVNTPIMLYNIPARTGINLAGETTIQLAQIENIIAVKESSADLDQMTKIITNAPSSFRLYSGDDNIILPVLAIGGYGVVSVASHVIGQSMREMIDAFLAGNIHEAGLLHQKLHPIFKGLFCAPNPAPVKYALSLFGIRTGGVRLPLIEVSDEEAASIRLLFSRT